VTDPTGTSARLRAALADRYEIGEEIGRGGMALVFKARDRRHDRDVAIKLLRPELAVALGAERFQREIQIESKLQHPHILTLHDSGHAGDLLYYVMPFVDGESLREQLKREGQLTTEATLAIARDVGSALAYAHDKGVIHRDVKPENILLASGQALLADFGIAQAVSDVGVEQLTDSGLAIGTPHYMSPEQADGRGRVDARSDIYSLGCVLFETLAGEPPFTGRTAQAVISRHMQERVPSLQVVRPGVPAHIAAAIEKSLAKNPVDRFPSVQGLLRALESPGTVPTPPAGWRAALRRWPARATVAGLAVAVVVAVISIVRPPSVALAREKVAVFPIAERGLPPEQAGAGRSMTYLIEAALDHAEPLRFIDVASRLGASQLADPELITAAEARTVARDRGAAFSLTGVVQGHGDSITVILRLADVAADSTLMQKSVTGGTAEPLHHLGIDAVTALLPALIDPGRAIDLNVIRDRQTAAVALWLQGELQYRQSQYARALDRYRRALAEDSALVVAAVKGAQAASWQHRQSEAMELVTAALERDSLIPPRYVSFTRGLHSYLTGDAAGARAFFEQAVTDNPDWAEARVALGEVFYHILPMSGPLDSLAESRFSEAIRLDSAFTPPLFHLSEAALRRGELPRADSLLERYRRVQPDSALLSQLSMMRACVQGDATVSWADLTTLDPSAAFAAAISLAVAGRQHRCAEDGLRAVLQSASASAAERWGATLALSALLVATGANAEALALLDSVTAVDGRARTLYVLYTLAGAPFERAARDLEAFASQTFGEDYERLPGTESNWVMGVWNAYVGAQAKVDALATALAARAAQSQLPRDRMFAEALAVHGSAMRTDTTAVVRRVLNLASTARGSDLAWAYGEALPVERLQVAELLLAQGRYRESYDAAAVFDHPGPFIFLTFVPRSLAVRYVAARALGMADVATQCRDRLVSLGREDLVRSYTTIEPGGAR
jgi:tRNA A-37 threonylcarbamoyl transferase component Bud32/TolB-like protein